MKHLFNSRKKREKAEKLYDCYHSLVRGVTYKILRYPEDAEDAASATWERALKKIELFEDVESQETKALLVLIAERTALNLYQKNRRKMKMEIPLDEHELSAYCVTKDKEIEEMEMKLWMRSLPKPYAEVMIMHYISGISQREIAKVCGISEAAVNMRMSRARVMLRERWMENG